MSCFAMVMLAAPASQAAVVFADDFSDPIGTAFAGKLPDVGMPWTENATPLSVSDSNTLRTNGAGREVYGMFTSSLGAGQILTLTYDAINVTFNDGYAGVSLYTQVGGERLFTGDLGGGGNASFGVDGGVIGSQVTSGNTSVPTNVSFTYAYDTGAWTFSTSSGVALSGTGVANEAFRELRVANGSGGDIEIDNLSVDISAVPEPSSLALLGLGGLALGLRRRR